MSTLNNTKYTQNATITTTALDFLDQELVSYCYFLRLLLRRSLQKSVRLRYFKSDWKKIWQEFLQVNMHRLSIFDWRSQISDMTS